MVICLEINGFTNHNAKDQKRFGTLSILMLPVPFKPLLSLGFFVVGSKELAGCLQSDRSRRLTETFCSVGKNR